ncbi:MAG TPA: CPBP family intramembrane glutamic endopeptidase [Mycobacteriales bacterium]
MTTTGGLAVTLLVMVAVNIWVHVGPRPAQLVTGPVAAAAVLLVARGSGLSWTQLGLGRQTLAAGARYAAVAAGAVGVAYGIGVLVPATRTAFRDTRYQLPASSALRIAVVAVPLGTVVFEEVAFRGVLWGLVDQDLGARWATAVSSVLFGLWHVLPALDLARTSTALRARGPRRLLPTVLGTVAFTTGAGVVFGGLRELSGSLLAPAGLHWATNGLGVLASALVWAVSRRSPPVPS